MSTIKKFAVFKDLANDLSLDDVLEVVGLQKRRGTASSFASVVGVFSAGLAVGAGVALLFAPKSGYRLRRELTEKPSDLGEPIGISSEKNSERAVSNMSHS